MYADDTVLIANSQESLQGMLIQLYQFNNDWNIGVNTEKTKNSCFFDTRAEYVKMMSGLMTKSMCRLLIVSFF